MTGQVASLVVGTAFGVVLTEFLHAEPSSPPAPGAFRSPSAW